MSVYVRNLIPVCAMVALSSSTLAQCLPSLVAAIDEPGAGGASFGLAMAIEGDVLAVGAPNGDSAGSNAGEVYVYARSIGPGGQTIWTLEQMLVSSVPTGGESFGTDLDICGNTLVVGVDSFGAPDGGAVYVFVREPDGLGGFQWNLQQRLGANDPQPSSDYGDNVAIDGDTIAVGAALADSLCGLSQIPTGAVYIFERTGTVWTQAAKVTEAGFLSCATTLGSKVGLAGDILVAGDRARQGPGAFNAGAVNVYERVPDGGGGTMWVFRAELRAPVPTSNGFYGLILDFDAQTLVVSDSGVIGGAINVFDCPTACARTSTNPAPVTSTAAFASMGAVAVHGDRIVAGDQATDLAGASKGAAYLFRRQGQIWFPIHLFTAPDAADPNTGLFGRSVAISGDDVIVAGISDITTTFAGRVYHFSLSALECAANPPCLGDSNADNIVNFDDLITSLGRWLQVCP